MAWESSNRRANLPKNWGALRQAVVERDRGRCQWPLPFGNETCGNREQLEVDHKRDPDDHSMSNLWTLCHDHHARKTSGESIAAKPKREAKKRRVEAHPNQR